MQVSVDLRQWIRIHLLTTWIILCLTNHITRMSEKFKFKMNWDIVFGILCIAGTTFAKEEPKDSAHGFGTGSGEAKWMWMSSNDQPTQNHSDPQLIQVVEVLEENEIQIPVAPDNEPQPRFVGHLRRKLCRVGLGIGELSENCGERSTNPVNRVKRSPQFLRVDDEDFESDKKSDRRGVTSPQTRLFGGTGLDGLGLNNLLNPKISPSFGVHVGAFPFGYGYHGGGYGGKGSPFQFNLGPLSINPLGGLRFSFVNGRPIIRPTLDLLVTKNKKKEYYNNPYNNYHPYNQLYPYHNRYIRDVRHPVISGQPGLNRVPYNYNDVYQYPPIPVGYKSSSIHPSVPIKSYRSEASDYSRATSVQKAPHYKVHFPLHKKVVFSDSDYAGSNPTSALAISDLDSSDAPILGLGFGKSNSGVGVESEQTESFSDSRGFRDSREDIYAKQ